MPIIIITIIKTIADYLQKYSSLFGWKYSEKSLLHSDDGSLFPALDTAYLNVFSYLFCSHDILYSKSLCTYAQECFICCYVSHLMLQFHNIFA